MAFPNEQVPAAVSDAIEHLLGPDAGVQVRGNDVVFTHAGKDYTMSLTLNDDIFLPIKLSDGETTVTSRIGRENPRACRP